VVRLGALGDVVRTLPAFRALRAGYPGAHITWLVERKAAGALAGQPGLDEVLLFPREELMARLRAFDLPGLWRRAGTFCSALRARRFDLVLDFHGILKSGALSRLSGASRRVGYARPHARELAWLFANQRVRLDSMRLSRFERNDALIEFLGLSRESGAAPFHLDPEAVEGIARRLDDGEPPVVIHPGTSPDTPHKRYGAERYAAIARALRDKGGHVCLVTAGPDEAEAALARRIVEASEGAAALAPPTPSVADLAALFARARLFVGGDSGPLHLASLVGTPVVQILGPTDPVENEPSAFSPWRRVRIPMACSPCRRGCRAATCMAVIPYEAVVEAACELLDEKPAFG
jgi:ADP-heptose:LPS heptosyltransferase